MRATAAEHREEIALRLTQGVQTNEVGRCAATMPALAQLAAEAPGAPAGGVRSLKP